MTTIVPSPSIREFFYDDNGKPLVSGKLYSYKAGTNELKNTYTDSTGLYVNTNPIILDDAGSCTIFISTNDADTTSDAYRFDLYDAVDNLIFTADNIYSLKGEQGTPGGPKGDRGEKGDQGIQGVQGPRGRSIKGDIGPKGDNGSESHFWRQAGTYTFTVPQGVNSIDYILGGGGGGFYIENTDYVIGQCATGVAGNIINGTISATGGDIITIEIGAGGLATANQSTANGKDSSFSSNLISVITATGGHFGNTHNLNSSAAYYQRLAPYFNFSTYDNTTYTIIPQPIYGESTQFGEGGNVYKNGNPNATGNCSSGGTGVPRIGTLQGATGLIIDTFGKGGDGICVFTFRVNND